MLITDEELDKFLHVLAAKLYNRRRARKRDPRLVMLCRARTRARNLLLPFDLRIEDISIPDKCLYLGIPIYRTPYEGRSNNSPSLDRIIPELGYVKGNIRVISDLANRMKQNATLEQLRTFAKNVLDIHPEN